MLSHMLKLGSSWSKIWHTPGVTHWDYTFLFIIFFLWYTMWSMVAILNFPDRVNQNIYYLGKQKLRGFLLALKDQIKNSEIYIFFTNCIGFPTIYNTCLYIAVLYVFSGFILDTPKISVTFVSLRVSFWDLWSFFHNSTQLNSHISF